jgi:hypothetical protein
MPDWELVLHRPDVEDDVVAMAYDGQLLDGEEFQRDDIRWVVVKDDGPPQVHEGCAARLVCEPKSQRP